MAHATLASWGRWLTTAKPTPYLRPSFAMRSIDFREPASTRAAVGLKAGMGRKTGYRAGFSRQGRRIGQ